MTTFECILKRAEGLGIPLAHNEFIKTNKSPLPEPPFMVWLSTERKRGSDTRNFIREIEASLELYTEKKVDPLLEKRIEHEILFDVEFKKNQAPIISENTVQTAYDFTIIQKIKENEDE